MSEENDRYGFLSEVDWGSVLEVLAQDVAAAPGAFAIIAPEHPEAGEEPVVYDELETQGMKWLPDVEPSPLSSRIMPACDSYSESHRMIAALENTLGVLRAHHLLKYG